MIRRNAQDMACNHKTSLKAFSHSLSHEAHECTRQSDLLWQQWKKAATNEIDFIRSLLGSGF